MSATHRSFPPGKGFVTVPTSSPDAARAGLALYAPCRPIAIWAWRASWYLVRVAGPRSLPGTAVRWEPPMEELEWTALADDWRTTVGDFDDVAVYEPRQRSRTGLAVLLLRGGRPLGFVKLRSDGSDRLDHEAAALEAVTRAQPRLFEAPRMMTIGRSGRWHYLMMSALEPRLHGIPKNPPLARLTDEIAEALDGLPRADGVPGHWRPMHGDFTPWNLRAGRDGSLTLVDWEEAGWAPPHADEVFYRAVAAALAGDPGEAVDGSMEAVEFWIQRVGRRLEAGRPDVDDAFGRQVLDSLNAMSRP